MTAKTGGLWSAMVVTRLLAACGGSATPTAGQVGASPASGSTTIATVSQDTRQSLIDGARKEGQLNLVWGQQSLGGTEGIPKMTAEFNNRYGLSLKVQLTPGPNFQEMGAKILQEYQTQRPASSDILNLSDSAMGPLILAGVLVNENWTSWAANIKPESVAPDGVGIVVETYLAGITYNSKKLSGDAIPRSMQDLLKPAVQGPRGFNAVRFVVRSPIHSCHVGQASHPGLRT